MTRILAEVEAEAEADIGVVTWQKLHWVRQRSLA
jgi:hypothetical protein